MCQCPTSGLPHFYVKSDVLTAFQKKVSMPYLGPSSFLPKYESCTDTGSVCVNALPRAFLISTYHGENSEWKVKMVSMPYLGPSSFLQEI